MNELPTLGQLWANNVVASLNNKPVTTPNTDNIMNIANQTIQKRTAKKQALADQLTTTPNAMAGGM